ncbi:Protein of unknown function DUF559 [Bradyrhizobiaceae bacterium SG-6C]|nr:Protein of unknown function DUF559 [Bradyrhizobiaceae bacterium SG-6C]
MIVEADGGQHSESHRDKIRDRKLADEGYRILRFWNTDILGNIDSVLDTIRSALLDELPLTPTLSP